MNKATKDYADDLNVAVVQHLFDGGTTYALSAPNGKRIRLTYYWGDDEARFDRSITEWLDAVPWPTEDDPRVAQQGVYL